MITMSNLGFLSYWGFGRGRAYTTLCVAKMLKGEHKVHIMQQGMNETAKEYEGYCDTLTASTNYHVTEEDFRKWIKTQTLDAVVLNEYGQWGDEPYDLVKVAKEEGCKVYGFFVIEKFDKKQVKGFDRVFTQCVTVERVMRHNKVRNFTYVPYSIDLKEFDRVKKPTDKFTFFHVGGFGGIHNRKNTQAVIDAFDKLNAENTRLVITTQKDYPLVLPDGKDIEVIRKDLSRDELLDLHQSVDIAVYPSKWETIGIPILEAMASSVPVIVSDAAPMNEFVKVGLNGYMASGQVVEYDDIAMMACEIDVDSLKNVMKNSMNKTIYDLISRNARYVVEQLYNLEKNKHYILDFLKKDLGEKK